MKFEKREGNILNKYTEEIIKGKKIDVMLPDGIGLVLEGGGMRGFYSAGVMDGFLEEEIMFPYAVAVSAGSANVLSYISGQYGRNRILIEKYVGKKEYSSLRNLIFKKSFFDFDYVFGTVAREHLFYDQDMFDANDVRLFTGAADCQTGETVWYDKKTLGKEFIPTIASCSIPVISKIVRFDGRELLDGGMTSPIPIEKSIEDGNKFHVVVLTRNKGYFKKPFKYKKTLSAIYKKYPKLIESVMKRHETYNRQLEICEQLEREGKALIIRPEKKLEVERFNKESDKLISLYEEGITDGKKAALFLKEKTREFEEKI